MKKPIVQFQSATANPMDSSVSDLTVEEFSKRTNDAHMIDVRRPDEYIGELGHIDGARLITLDVVFEHFSELPKDEPIVFICRSGARSARAAAMAQEVGFKNVFNLKGGMLRWNELGLPIVKKEK